MYIFVHKINCKQIIRSLRVVTLQNNGAKRGGQSLGNMSRDELDRTKYVRIGQRIAAVTRLGKEITDIIAANETSQDKITRLKVLQTSLEDKVVVLKDLDLKLLELIDGNEIEDDIKNSSEVEIKIRENIATCQQFLDNQLELESLISSQRSASPVTHSEIPLSHVQSEANTPPASENSSSSSQRHIWNKVTLPTLELPTFNGEITQFFSFWDSFESMVGANEDLSSIDKFNYLQRSLRGEL